MAVILGEQTSSHVGNYTSSHVGSKLARPDDEMKRKRRGHAGVVGNRP